MSTCFAKLLSSSNYHAIENQNNDNIHLPFKLPENLIRCFCGNFLFPVLYKCWSSVPPQILFFRLFQAHISLFGFDCECIKCCWHLYAVQWWLKIYSFKCYCDYTIFAYINLWAMSDGISLTELHFGPCVLEMAVSSGPARLVDWCPANWNRCGCNIWALPTRYYFYLPAINCYQPVEWRMCV